jgi:AcrR family transcriptional regulator
MSRNAVLTKEQITMCAFDIAKNKGKKAITVREIANQLGKSTAPIYTQYSGIDEIFIDLMSYIEKLIFQSSIESIKNSSFLSMGIGFLSFALENKRVFNDFFLTMDNPLLQSNEEEPSYLDLVRQDAMLSVLSEEQLRTIFYDMQVYTYGLATIICTRSDANTDLKFYQDKLEQVGKSIIRYHLFSSGKYEEAFSKVLASKKE